MACCLSPSRRCLRQQRGINSAINEELPEADRTVNAETTEVRIRPSCKQAVTSGECDRNKLCDGLCGFHRKPDSCSPVEEISDSSLDIDLDDPNLLQALEECIQRGGMNTKAVPVNAEESKVTVTKQLNDLDFIGLFFKSVQQGDSNTTRNTNIAQDVTIECKDCQKKFIIAPREPASATQKLGVESEVYVAGVSEGSSSQPSCYQTGTNNSVPVAPANSPNESRATYFYLQSTKRRSAIKHRPGYKPMSQHAIVRRRKSTLPSYYRRPLRRRLIASLKSGTTTTSPDIVDQSQISLGARPPCLGQEFSPIRKSPGVGQESTPEAANISYRSRLRRRQSTRSMCRGCGYRTNTQFGRFSQRGLNRQHTVCPARNNECSPSQARPQIIPLHQDCSYNCLHMDQKSAVKQLACDSGLNTVHPPLVVIENSAHKVQLWLNHLEDESLEIPCSRTSIAGSIERVYENQVPTISYPRNRRLQLSYSRRKRTRAGVTTSGQQKTPVVECSLSTDMYSDDNDVIDDQDKLYNMKWRRCGEADSDGRTEAVSSTGFLADRSATTDTKSSLPLTDSPPSGANGFKSVQPSSELTNKLVSNLNCEEVDERTPVNNAFVNSLICDNLNDISIMKDETQTPVVREHSKNKYNVSVASAQQRHLTTRQRRVRQPLASSNCDTAESDTTAFLYKPLAHRVPVSRDPTTHRKITVLRRFKAIGRRIRLFKDSENILQTLAIL